MAVAFTRQSHSTPAPGELVPFVSSDKSFSVLHPDNWPTAETGSQGTMTRVTFDPSDDVHISVTSDLTASLVADASRGGSGMLGQFPGSIGQAANQPSPLETAHALQRDRIESHHDTYPAFADGQTTKADINGREALITTFTFSRPAFPGTVAMAGKRVTLLFKDRGMSIVCACPESQQATLMPVFDKIIGSLKGE